MNGLNPETANFFNPFAGTPGQMAESIFHGYYSCFCTSFVQDDYSTSGKQAFFTVSQFIPTFIPSHVGINVF